MLVPLIPWQIQNMRFWIFQRKWEYNAMKLPWISAHKHKLKSGKVQVHQLSKMFLLQVIVSHPNFFFYCAPYFSPEVNQFGAYFDYHHVIVSLDNLWQSKMVPCFHGLLFRSWWSDWIIFQSVFSIQQTKSGDKFLQEQLTATTSRCKWLQNLSADN